MMMGLLMCFFLWALHASARPTKMKSRKDVSVRLSFSPYCAPYA